MSFDPSTAPHLKPWLVKTLEPICDAEPGALADYILALLKHNAPENDMRKELVAQLDEFLEKECVPFIDTLFTVLRTKSYLPYGANSASTSFSPPNPPPVDTGIPIPLDALLSPSSERTRKRSIDNDERDGRPSAKGQRVSSEGQFSRYSNGRNVGMESRSTGAWGTHGNMQGLDDQGMGSNNINPMNGMNGAMNLAQPNGMQLHPYRPPPPKRGICRDYHNNGYCARGSFCKFSHGEDAVVPGQLFPSAGPAMQGPLPFMPMFPNGPVPFPMGPGSTYDPHEAQMDMRPLPPGMGPNARIHSRTPLLPRVQQDDGAQHSIHASGELPVIQDLTPHMNPTTQNNHLNLSIPPTNVQTPIPQQLPPNGTIDINSLAIPMAPPIINGHGNFRAGSHGGRGRGIFSGDVHNFRPERRNDKTLVVEKIPEDKLSLDSVNGWFKRFGTVTNVAVDAANAKALVSFSSHDEAHAAWKSEDAVFNNRFVKIYWHRPMEGHGQVGARMLAASAPLVASISNKQATTPTPPAARPASPAAVASASFAPRTTSNQPTTSTSTLAAKQRLLEQQIAEQKRLMGLLATASMDEKKQIMASLRKLGDEMKPPSGSTPPLASTSATEKNPASIPRSDDREQKEKERLDKELELHNATLAVKGETEETTEDLKVKLEKLKAEAASLGISTEPTYGGSHRPYRGRGRGTRGYNRGAARGAPRGSMKLDNRPKKLVIKGVGDDGVQAVRDWYQSTGQMESLETFANSDIVVTFRSRNAAEQGLSKGTKIPPLGQVQVSWFNGHLPSNQQQATPSASYNGTEDKNPTLSPLHEPLSPDIQEEEVVASGWGGGGDDGDGMGML